MVRLAGTGRIATLPDPLVFYRIRRRSASTTYRSLCGEINQAADGGAPQGDPAGERRRAVIAGRVRELERRLGAGDLERQYRYRLGWAALRGGRWALALANFGRSLGPGLLLDATKGCVLAVLGLIRLRPLWRPVVRLDGAVARLRRLPDPPPRSPGVGSESGR